MGIPITANMNQPLRTREFSIRLPRFHPEYFPAVDFRLSQHWSEAGDHRNGDETVTADPEFSNMKVLVEDGWNEEPRESRSFCPCNWSQSLR